MLPPFSGAQAPQIVAASRQMRDLQALARRAGGSDAKVLITGESGVGKDLIAREVHYSSSRRTRAYVAVNCAGFPETLLESELFGHARGSFTGAHRDQRGRLQVADGGTLFLDEVGEMSPRMQALLLRFLETGEIQPVGSTGPMQRVDVRVIAATNRDLSARVAAGQFREDLLYRLRVIHLHVPPLRERPDDIRALVGHFARAHGKAVEFSEEAIRMLVRYRWPGNVRELQNVISQAAWFAERDTVHPDDLPAALRTAVSGGLVLQQERRRQVADQLFEALVAGNYSFWDHVHPLFMSRDITRHDIRELVKRGLTTTRGNYRALLRLFGIPATEYYRFHNFLTAHDCKVDFRSFRTASPPAPRERVVALPPAS
jgi:transcriptional regulator with PAS, ATPase and Fis domain